LKILGYTGNEDIAKVFVGRTDSGHTVEFLESVQPPIPREQKWVLIVSTLAGCPVGCPLCDAGGFYRGRLTAGEILDQIDYLVIRRYPDRRIPIDKFKIQFARMGDPALNPDVLTVLKRLPELYHAPGLRPCISSIAPLKSERFFEDLLAIKAGLYPDSFQMQFSIHSTDADWRDKLVPMKKWPLEWIADYGRRFRMNDSRKITLNFAMVEDVPVDPTVLLKYFEPDTFLLKITPVNPTITAVKNNLNSYIDTCNPEREYALIDDLRQAGYDVIVSIGELEENQIGSNCGQYVMKYQQEKDRDFARAYSYAFNSDEKSEKDK